MTTVEYVVWGGAVLFLWAVALWQGLKSLRHEYDAKILAVWALEYRDRWQKAKAELDRVIPFAEPVEQEQAAGAFPR